MGLDGATLYAIKEELKEKCIGSKVEKVTMPQKDRVILHLSAPSFKGKLLLCCNPITPRIQLTNQKFENPESPPMICMLLRKKLGGGRLKKIEQVELDRILLLDFECRNELGDLTTITVAVEVLGRVSNIVFVENGKIIDSLRRFDPEEGKRFVLPDAKYELPPSLNKANIFNITLEDVKKLLQGQAQDLGVQAAICETFDGFSPLIAKELCFRAKILANNTLSELNDTQISELAQEIFSVKDKLNKGNNAYLIKTASQPKEFTFLKLENLPQSYEIEKYDNFGDLLDAFYTLKDEVEHLRNVGGALKRSVNNLVKRAKRKIVARQEEFKKCESREDLRIKGELIKANLHLIKPGDTYLDAINYYNENCDVLRVPLDSALSATRNAQKYFKDYKKASTAAGMLDELIKKAQLDLEYLESVAQFLETAKSTLDFEMIKEELIQSKYLKNARRKNKRPLKSNPHKYISNQGFTILVGKNNLMNDELTMKMAAKSDLWLHAKNMPGSHVIVLANSETIPNETITFAAQIAAFYSKGSASGQVAVDYTLVRNLKKPTGAKPGKVIYHEYNTTYVAPQNPEL